MSIDNIRKILADPEKLERQAFVVLSQISRMHTKDPESSDVQELILRALEKRDHFNGSRPILDALARERGLFPYLDYNSLSTADKLAYEFHKPTGFKDMVFHGPQARVYNEIMKGNSVILSAPTSFGKSLIIDAVILSNKYRNILIIVPTIALIDETRRRIASLSSGYKLITHASQKPTDTNIYIMTQERALDNSDIDTVELFVIDEFYKLSPSRGDDERSAILNQVFYRLAAQKKQFYMLGPSIKAISDEVTHRFECKFIYEPYHTVVSELHYVKSGVDVMRSLTALCKEIEGPTLIYCRSPRRAADVAKRLATERKVKQERFLTEAAEWIAHEYHPEWHVAEALRSGIGVHHGRVPRSIAHFVMRAFDSDLLDILVCTSSMIEGVNTKAKNVIIFDDTVSMQKYDYFTFNNIRGRSGRMFRHFVGHVYLFHPPPSEELPFIDVPAITQSDEAANSLLIQLDQDDLIDASEKRVRPYKDQNILSFETLKANRGVDPDAQLAVAESIAQSPDAYSYIFNWKQYPSYDQLKGVCLLIWEHFNGRSLGSSSVLTAAQLAYRINQLRQRPSIRELIEAQMQFMKSRDSAASPDEAVQNVLDFLRLWPGFHFPRLLNAIDKIQKEILPKHGYRSGDLGPFAAQVENLFLDPVISALEEYGIPIQLGIKLPKAVHTDGDLDAALITLKKMNAKRLKISLFEQQLLEDAILAIG